MKQSNDDDVDVGNRADRRTASSAVAKDKWRLDRWCDQAREVTAMLTLDQAVR